MERAALCVRDFSSFLNRLAVVLTFLIFFTAQWTECRRVEQKMQRSDKAHDSATQQNGVEPLPLFRPEALAAQQHKFYGQIVLIRPFSLLFLGLLGFVIAASTAAFLVLGHYTEKAYVSGILLVQSSNPTSASPQLTADFYVPSRWRARRARMNSESKAVRYSRYPMRR